MPPKRWLSARGAPTSLLLLLVLLLLSVRSVLCTRWETSKSATKRRSSSAAVSCAYDCARCVDSLAAGDHVADSEFGACNACGGWTIDVSCTATLAAYTQEVIARLEAGRLVSLVGPYALTADCSRRLLLVRWDAPGESWTVVATAGRASSAGSLQGLAFAVALETEAPAGGRRLDLRDPLSPPVRPHFNQELRCVVEKQL